ncbi:hypothetical protein ACWIUA_07515 [Ursidibacter sp. B-7004-1]
MEIFIIIIGIVFLFIFFSAKSGVGIKSSLIKDIRTLHHTGMPSVSHPSIALEEAYEVLSPYDANNRISNISNQDSYSFWVLVSGEPCLIIIKREPFKKTGIKLILTTANEYNSIHSSIGIATENIPNNLKSI